MNIANLITEAARAANIAEPKIQKLLAHFWTRFGATLAAGDAVTMPGVGAYTAQTQPRVAVRDPDSGETIKLPADRAARIALVRGRKADGEARARKHATEQAEAGQ